MCGMTMDSRTCEVLGGEAGKGERTHDFADPSFDRARDHAPLDLSFADDGLDAQDHSGHGREAEPDAVRGRALDFDEEGAFDLLEDDGEDESDLCRK